jgi:adenosine deaminase
MRDLRALPKAHLHLHLEGAMRPETLRAMAEVHGLDVPAVRGFGSFSAFAGMYVAACEVVRSHEDLSRLVREVLEDAARDGAVWVEPAVYLPRHRGRLGHDEAILETVLDAMAAAASGFGIGAGLVVSADRTVDPVEALGQAALAVRYRDVGVVGFGLANDEALRPPEPFARAFAVAREGGLLSVPHAGELEGPASIGGALDGLGADRVQHGVRAIEDPELVKRLADADVCLDVCPTSNLALAVYPSFDAHPIGRLLDAGVACSVNADDPLLFGSGLLEEYELCRNELAFDDVRLAQVARCSIEASAAPEDYKRDALEALSAWLA